MKQALRGIIVNSIAIAIVSYFLPGVQFGGSLLNLTIAATVFGIANTFLKPILSLILLPITIITLGIAGLFMNTLLLFIATLIVPAFSIIPFSLHLLTGDIFIPLIWSYFLCSLAINFVAGIIRSIIVT